MKPEHVVTRFAPSPTGNMHVGGVRTALYAWLFARKHGGTFILRIEDTDKAREVQGSIEQIISSLHWLGIEWDEGVDIGGSHAPYLQSQRIASYQTYARLLIDKGYAYPDPYTEAEVEAFRQKAEAEKRPFLYREFRPETFGVWDGTKPLRFKVPEVKRYEWHDLVRGTLSAGEEALDDFILIKSDGYPTYNFAHIIDDFEMGVTHVMRGQEFISSTPKFLSLYDALGFPYPAFATMPPILAADGKKKLGKRDGAKDVLEYRDEGFVPEALMNFLAFIGWNPGDEREVMTASELIEAFSLEHLHKAGAQFNEEKLLWFNQKHLQLLPRQEYCDRLRSYMQMRDITIPPFLEQVAHLLVGRTHTLLEAATVLTSNEFAFMYETIETPSKDLLTQRGKIDPSVALSHLHKIADILKDVADTDFFESFIKELIFPYATQEGRGNVLWPMRVALSGLEKSPDPFMLAGLLGKQRTIERIEAAAKLF